MTFELTVLGSGAALPAPKRFSTAHLLNVDERFFLIDCGEGTQIQLQRYNLRYGKINHIFISHYHGDHLFGLFGLLSTFSLLERKNDLHLYGHPFIEEMVHSLIMKFNENPGFKIIFHSLDYSKVCLLLDDEKVEISSFPLKHKIPACGFIFKEKQRLRNILKEAIEKYNIPVKNIPGIKAGADFITENNERIPNSQLTHAPLRPRSYVFCSDTKYCEDIIEIIKGVDLLYHEATFTHDLVERAVETGHSTARQAAEIALKAGVKQLLIGHFSIRYKTTEALLTEAQSVFPNTLAAQDGLLIKIPAIQ